MAAGKRTEGFVRIGTRGYMKPPQPSVLQPYHQPGEDRQTIKVYRLSAAAGTALTGLLMDLRMDSQSNFPPIQSRMPNRGSQGGAEGGEGTEL